MMLTLHWTIIGFTMFAARSWTNVVVLYEFLLTFFACHERGLGSIRSCITRGYSMNQYAVNQFVLVREGQAHQI